MPSWPSLRSVQSVMTMDPLVLLTDVDDATEMLLRTVADLDPAAVAAPSLLPGWTTGHVLTHLARNADALTNLLTWARTGVETPAYASAEAREAAIGAGAGRPLREQVEDLKAAHERFADACAAMPAEAWTVRLPPPGQPAALQPAAAIPWYRLREVEVHHVDLGAGYTPSAWPDAFALRLLREIVTGAGPDVPPMQLRPFGLEHALTIGTAPDPPVIGGPTRSIAAWLTGRADGADLTVSPDGALPTPPRWK
jgi:maleylpyruvate isomerase